MVGWNYWIFKIFLPITNLSLLFLKGYYLHILIIFDPSLNIINSNCCLQGILKKINSMANSFHIYVLHIPLTHLQDPSTSFLTRLSAYPDSWVNLTSYWTTVTESWFNYWSPHAKPSMLSQDYLFIFIFFEFIHQSF